MKGGSKGNGTFFGQVRHQLLHGSFISLTAADTLSQNVTNQSGEYILATSMAQILVVVTNNEDENRVISGKNHRVDGIKGNQCASYSSSYADSSFDQHRGQVEVRAHFQ